MNKRILSSTPFKILIKCAKKGGVNNHYAKCKCKGMKTVRVKDYTNYMPSKHFGWKKCLSSTPLKKGNIDQMGTKYKVHIFNR